MSGGYLTAAGEGEAEYTDKKSRFLACVRPVGGEEEAKAFLQERRRLYPDAAHHVYAYVLRAGDVLRWSDDGEPGGTSGQPTLNVLRGAGLQDVCCVTTRYFGGILLGSGGLVRAYSAAARLALQAAGTLRMLPWRQGAIACSYAQYERLCRLLGERGARVEDSRFGARVELIFTAPAGIAESLEGQVRDATAGSAELCLGGEVLRGERE